jgi:3-oxoacyl-[acyl-carrier protein] reductase
MDKAAVITGGGRGLGQGISRGLAAAGFGVAVVYHSRPQPAEQLAREIEAAGGRAIAYACDVAQAEQVDRLVARVLTDFGRLDVLVNNAGIATRSGSAELSASDWDRVLDVNLKGAFLCARAVIPHMQSRAAGRIINISSIAGQTGGGIGPHYAASKAGLIGLTRFMARELGPHGITVNSVAPSGVPTEMLATLGLPATTDRPARRLGTPEDIAAAVCYLASDAAGFVTGQVLAVNGGSFIG